MQKSNPVPRRIIGAAERKRLGGTLYFEFQRGPYRERHWLADSVYLYADVFDELQMYSLFIDAIPHFNYYGPTEVTAEQFAALRELAARRSGETAAIIGQLAPHAEGFLETDGVFTICGI